MSKCTLNATVPQNATECQCWEPLIFKCVVSLFGLVPGTDACFTDMVSSPAAIVPGVASGTVSGAFSISELSAALNSMVVVTTTL